MGRPCREALGRREEVGHPSYRANRVDLSGRPCLLAAARLSDRPSFPAADLRGDHPSFQEPDRAKEVQTAAALTAQYRSAPQRPRRAHSLPRSAARPCPIAASSCAEEGRPRPKGVATRLSFIRATMKDRQPFGLFDSPKLSLTHHLTLSPCATSHPSRWNPSIGACALGSLCGGRQLDPRRSVRRVGGSIFMRLEIPPRTPAHALRSLPPSPTPDAEGPDSVSRLETMSSPSSRPRPSIHLNLRMDFRQPQAGLSSRHYHCHGRLRERRVCRPSGGSKVQSELARGHAAALQPLAALSAGAGCWVAEGGAAGVRALTACALLRCAKSQAIAVLAERPRPPGRPPRGRRRPLSQQRAFHARSLYRKL